MCSAVTEQKSTLKTFDGIKWEYIEKFDIQEIIAEHQTQIIKTFIKHFKRIKLSDNPKDYDNPLIVNLLKLCQISCEMLVEGSIKYKTTIEQKNDMINKLQEKYLSLEESYKKARNLLEQIKGEINPCPICKRKFKTPEFLDKHFLQKHPEYVRSWNNIRKQIPDVSVSTNEEIAKKLYEINKNISGNELDNKNKPQPPNPPQKQAKILPLEQEEEDSNIEITKEVEQTKEKPHVTFFDIENDSDQDDGIKIIPKSNPNTATHEEATPNDSLIQQSPRQRRKLKVKRKVIKQEEPEQEHLHVHEPESEQVQDQKPEQEPETTPKKPDKEEREETKEKDDRVKQTENNQKNEELSQIEEGMLQTSLMEPSSLEFYDNNLELSFMQQGAFDESTFVDEEPPLLRL